MNEMNNKTTILTAPEIVCGGCATSIKKALGNIEGISEVDVNIESKKIIVNHDENVSRGAIVETLDRAGFEAS